MYDILFQSVSSALAIKQATDRALARLGIRTIRDLLFYRPYSYKIVDIDPDLSNVKSGSEIVCSVTVHDIEMPRTRRAPTKIYTANESGELILVFFNKIPPFIMAKLREGAKVTVSGKIEHGRAGHADRIAQINHPDFFFRKDLIKQVQPIYHLTYGIINKQLHGYILDAITAFEMSIKARVNFGNMHGKGDSNIFNNEEEYIKSLLGHIKQLHLITSSESSAPTSAQLDSSLQSLAAYELYSNQVSLHNLRTSSEKNAGHVIQIASLEQTKVMERLGFTLTEGQASAIAEIQQDQQLDIQMMRLLQGDVGSGKTLVALLTILNAVNTGFQACIMAPTDLLSQQHYEFFCKALESGQLVDDKQLSLPKNSEDKGSSHNSHKKYNVALLTGKTKAKERRLIKDGLESGKIDILIGTHALFQEEVEFKNLGYVIIDEQHRFGVQQRLDLINKASHPDVLVMTATPIPRSLTLTMFGDMAVSQIKTKPKNRLPIITGRLSTEKRHEVIASLANKFADGDRVYWVCPLIDPSDKSMDEASDGEGESTAAVPLQYSDVTTRIEEIEFVYPGKGGVLHGKMKAKEKDDIMRKFKDGEVDYIVATTVIEVGIDVPEATLIVIENAEKFGLAQLHQLRGRVGRGARQSHCMLLYNPKNYTKTAQQRLKIMRDSNDGFYIAEQDLILRGGGEILGTRQSGEPDFFFADLSKHTDILVRANKFATSSEKSMFQEFQLKLFARDQETLAKSG